VQAVAEIENVTVDDVPTTPKGSVWNVSEDVVSVAAVAA
jgi:hypothetical protein